MSIAQTTACRAFESHPICIMLCVYCLCHVDLHKQPPTEEEPRTTMADSNLAVFLELDGPTTAPQKIVAFLRHHAYLLRQGRLWDIWETMARCYDVAATQIEEYEQQHQAARSRIEQAIREHRDARGDDRCWQDDDVLYSILPEGYSPPPRDSSVELDRCRQYIASRQHPLTTYISPQRRIEELETALAITLSKCQERQTHIRLCVDVDEAAGCTYDMKPQEWYVKAMALIGKVAE